MPCVVSAVRLAAPADVSPLGETVSHVPRQAEIEQPRTGARQHHVARLQIAMHDTGAMRRRQRFRDLNADIERFLDRQRAARQPLRQRLSLEKLHDQEEAAAHLRRQLADVVERADVGMFEPRNTARLALESLAADRIVGQRRRHHFDRHGAIEASVGGAIDLPHPALADQPEDFIGTESCAGWQHRWIGREECEKRFTFCDDGNNKRLRAYYEGISALAGGTSTFAQSASVDKKVPPLRTHDSTSVRAGSTFDARRAGT